MPRKQKEIHYIYKTTNIINGKFYIGMHSTDNPNDGYLGSGKRLRYSLNKYGKENHLFEILERCETREALKNREREIVNLELLQNPLCLNLGVGGEGGWMLGMHHSEETKKKLSESNKNRDCVPTEEARIKMSLATKGSKLTEEHKKKIGAVHKGKQVSAETRMKLSEAGKGKVMPDEQRKKIAESSKGILKPNNCRIVIVNGMEYRSLRDAAASLGFNHHIKLRRMIDSKDPKFSGIYYKDEPKEQIDGN